MRHLSGQHDAWLETASAAKQFVSKTYFMVNGWLLLLEPISRGFSRDMWEIPTTRMDA